MLLDSAEVMTLFPTLMADVFRPGSDAAKIVAVLVSGAFICWLTASSAKNESEKTSIWVIAFICFGIICLYIMTAK